MYFLLMTYDEGGRDGAQTIMHFDLSIKEDDDIVLVEEVL